jgi:methylated-DNA-protein-cysteine methyltransferase related protein
MNDAAPKRKRIIGPGFRKRVYEMVSTVPFGYVTTYGDVAEVLGEKRIARHIGFALAALPEEQSHIPWHRVINSQGRISFRGDDWRGEEQLLRLSAEGGVFDENGRLVDFSLKRFLHPSPE